MALTFPLPLPDTTSIQEIEFTQNTIVGATRSIFTGEQQVQAHQGKWWTVRCVLIPKKRWDGENWVGFFTSLNGPEGSFVLGDQHNAQPRGSALTNPGTPLVNGASQVGDRLAIDGCPNNSTQYLKRGDWIQLGFNATARLYRVTEDADTNGSGEVTLEIWPDLRSSPGNNDPVALTNTAGHFRLSEAFKYRIDREHFYAIEFSATEIL